MALGNCLCLLGHQYLPQMGLLSNLQQLVVYASCIDQVFRSQRMEWSLQGCLQGWPASPGSAYAGFYAYFCA